MNLGEPSRGSVFPWLRSHCQSRRRREEGSREFRRRGRARAGWRRGTHGETRLRGSAGPVPDTTAAGESHRSARVPHPSMIMIIIIPSNLFLSLSFFLLQLSKK